MHYIFTLNPSNLEIGQLKYLPVNQFVHLNRCSMRRKSAELLTFGRLGGRFIISDSAFSYPIEIEGICKTTLLHIIHMQMMLQNRNLAYC